MIVKVTCAQTGKFRRVAERLTSCEAPRRPEYRLPLIILLLRSGWEYSVSLAQLRLFV
jgi:hypothetical protein